MPITTTGQHRIDQATSEIAGHLRDADPGKPDQHYYDLAALLRDEIMAGTLSSLALLPPWRPANNGSGKRMWFLYRDESVHLSLRYYCHSNGTLVRYASFETAQKAADKLNAQEAQA